MILVPGTGPGNLLKVFMVPKLVSQMAIIFMGQTFCHLTMYSPISYSQPTRNSVFSDEFMFGPALNLLLFGENGDHGSSIADDIPELAQGLVCVDWLPMYGEQLASLREICLHVFMVSTPAKACKSNCIAKFWTWDSVSCLWLHP